MAKKVLHIVLRDYHDEYSYQENLLSQKHKELGYDVSVITSQLYVNKEKKVAFHEVKKYRNDFGILVNILQCNVRSNIKAVFFDQTVGLYQAIEEVAPEIIFMHNFAYRDVRHVVKYVQTHSNVRLYADCHTDYYNSNYHSFAGRLKALFARRQGHILNKVAIKFWGTTPWRSEFMRDVYKLPQDKIETLIMGADESQILNKDKFAIRNDVRKKYKIPFDAFVVVSGGKIDKRKQQNLLLEAVSKMEDQNVWLILFGTPTDEMKPVVEQYSNCKNIIMPGWMTADETYPLFFASDLAFFPGTHSVLWEQSVASSLPLVVKRWAGMEHVKVNDNAILLEEVNFETVKSTIQELLFTEKYQAMKAGAEKCASQFFLKEIALKAIEE